MADDDLATIRTPIDFLAVTYYLRLTVADAAIGSGPEHDTAGPENVDDWLDGFGLTELAMMERQQTMLAELLNVTVVDTDEPVTRLGWVIAPDGLTNVLCAIRDRYQNPPVYIAENGADFPDTVRGDGSVDDPDRQSFLRDHLLAAHRAIRAGVDLRGFSIWALFDDATSNFGLVHVDPETQRRTMKASGYWYRDVIAANGLDEPAVLPHG